jgi:hypothetical protein
MATAAGDKPLEPLSAAGVALAARLGSAAQQQAHSALEAYGRADAANFYVHAGIALELAIKSRLAVHSVFFLIGKTSDWFAAGCRLAGLEPDANRVVTVGGADALARLRILDKALPSEFIEQVTTTIERRNEVIHLGLSSKPSDAELLKASAAFVRAISELLRWKPERFWGNHEELAGRLVDEELDAVQVRVAVATANAERQLRQLTVEAQVAIANATLEWFETIADYDSIEVTCPVCQWQARGSGIVVDEGDLVEDPEPDEADPRLGDKNLRYVPDFRTNVLHLNCDVCGLSLSGPDELRVAGLTDLSIRNERANRDTDFQADYNEMLRESSSQVDEQ